MDLPAGKRSATTLRKLPTATPSKKNRVNQAAVIAVHYRPSVRRLPPSHLQTEVLTHAGDNLAHYFAKLSYFVGLANGLTETPLLEIGH